ncbi:MAG: glutamine-hydrolyzing carbamoyl-phosphate synthase small subunit [Bacteroidia bacterium]|nr:glutamine-hydrolyzing carbamoyl-phosphate synthase small subunit [Bacteroidia bacterium]
MSVPERPDAILLLSDGTVFEGKSIGKIGTTTGELAFNTGMTGYQEVFTDPSYFGQILIATHTHIGNYGTIKSENESQGAKIAGLVVKNFAWNPSRYNADNSLQGFLEESGIVGISNIDTRQLVRHIRTKGAMNAIISSEYFSPDELESRLAACPPMDGLELASRVSCTTPYFAGDPGADFKVAALDIGIKNSILRCLVDRGCYVKVFPAKTPFEEMAAFAPDGYFLSNGPGDPAAMDYAVETCEKILAADKPLFGICLGHQILARASGLPTYKMKFGHRGINHPVKNLESGRSEMTSQNHGFAVSLGAALNADDVDVTHTNLNDDTLEGIRVRGKKAFSVQYHPEASPGPHDSRYLFDQFIEMMQAERELVKA